MTKVLIVDDDPKFRASVVPSLQEKGYSIVQAASGAEAAVELALGGVDLVIVDGQLPDIDGTELIEQIRATDGKIKVIFVSAHWRDAESYLNLTSKLGVAVVLHKPVPPAVLTGHVERLVGIPLGMANSTMALQAAVEVACAQYAVELPGEIDHIATLVEMLKMSPNSPDVVIDAKRRAHKLRGTAGSCGFSEVGNCMGIVEDTLHEIQKGRLGAWKTELYPQLEGALKRARELAMRPSEEADDTGAPKRSRILVVTNDLSMKQKLRPLKTNFDVDLCGENYAQDRLAGCHGVMMHAPTGVDMAKYYDMVKHLSTPGINRIPFAFITDQQIAPEWSLYLGLEPSLPANLNIDSLSTFANHMIAARNHASVLVIDDDLNFVRKIEAVLSYEGIVVHGFGDSSKFKEILDQLSPDLLLLDGDMPGISGFDICRAIRSSDNWRELPIIFVTALSSWESRVAAYESGADDYLIKPVVNMELIARVKTRLGRRRLAVEQSNYDPVTGLRVHRKFVESCHQSQPNAAGGSLGIVHFENLDALNQDHGADLGDKLLTLAGELMSGRFRLEDTSGRWSGSKIAVYCRGISPETLESALSHYVNELQAVWQASQSEIASPQIRTKVVEIKAGSPMYSLVKPSAVPSQS